MMMIRTAMAPCLCTVLKIDEDKVVLDDSGQGMSITNAAEYVVAYVHKMHPGKQVFYYDTDGQYDELVHNEGEFMYFRPGP